jgi:ribose 5-phosphate isomerase B
MNKIYIGADHRGFKLKEKLKEWLKEGQEEFEDVGNDRFDFKDDYTDYARKVAEAVGLDKVAKGVVICGSGIGVSIVVNRYKGVRGAIGFDLKQVKHGVESDNINVLCLAADYVSFNEAKRLIKSFISSSFKKEPKDIRRIKKIDPASAGRE